VHEATWELLVRLDQPALEDSPATPAFKAFRATAALQEQQVDC